MKLFDLIALYNRSVTPAASTVHLATWNGHEQPVAVYRSGRFEEWQRWQAQKVFERPYIVGLAKMPERTDRWLFVGCFKQLGCKPSPSKPEAWLYDTVELQDVRPLAGRAVIHHPRSGRRSTRHGTSVSERLEVLEIREKPLDVEPFRTYSEVRLMKAELDRIVVTDEPSWRVALSAVSGVYVITDTSNGKLYVGSATGDTSAGEGGIWSRWRCYSQTGHGGNDQLIATLAPTQSGPQHALHFQFSILEIADTHANADDVRRREQHWKQVLQSHAHGYNSNL